MQKSSGINVGGTNASPCPAKAARPNRVRRPACQRLGFHVEGPGTAPPAIPTRRDETTLSTTNSKEFSA